MHIQCSITSIPASNTTLHSIREGIRRLFLTSPVPSKLLKLPTSPKPKLMSSTPTPSTKPFHSHAANTTLSTELSVRLAWPKEYEPETGRWI